MWLRIEPLTEFAFRHVGRLTVVVAFAVAAMQTGSLGIFICAMVLTFLATAALYGEVIHWLRMEVAKSKQYPRSASFLALFVALSFMLGFAQLIGPVLDDLIAAALKLT